MSTQRTDGGGRRPGAAALWFLLAAASSAAFLYFSYQSIRAYIRWQELPSMLQVVMVTGFAVLAAVYWQMVRPALGGRVVPVSSFTRRMAGVVLLGWSACVAFLALEAQVGIALLWATLGLVTAVALLVGRRP